MKILNIKPNTYLHKNNKTTAPKTFQTYKFEKSQDILDINFTSNNKYPHSSDNFLSTVKDDFLRDRAINEVIKDNDGNYRSETEEMFLSTFSNVYNACIEEGDEATEGFRDTLLIATIDAFRAIKDEDGNFDLSHDIPSLILTALDALENNIYDYEEIFEYARDNNGKINEPLAELVCLNRINYPNIKNGEMFYMFSNYFREPNTGIINTEAIPVMLGLFSFADAENLKETDILYSLIVNDERKFDQDRYDFTFDTIEDLHQVVQEEVSEESQVQDKNEIKGMIYHIIHALQQSNIQQNGKFDLMKAKEAFNDWHESAQCGCVIYGNEGLNPRYTRMEAPYDSEGKTSVYNTSLYKLFNVLCVY
ncbi:hypothetical protein IJ425_06180 [bacterium]|nr:hypothetical protein [bacterium]